jgi:uncharacterized protein YkuJ
LEGKTIKDRTFSLHTGGNKVFPYNEVDLTSYKVKSIEPTLNLTIDIKEMLENPNAYNFERDGYDVHSPANSSNDKILENMKDMVKLSSLKTSNQLFEINYFSSSLSATFKNALLLGAGI